MIKLGRKVTREKAKVQKARPGTFRRLLSYTRVAWRLLLALFSCIIIKSLLELSIPWVMGFLLFDGVIAKGNLAALPSVVGILAAIFLAQKGFSFLQEYLNELTNQRIVHRIRCDLYEHIERLPLKFFDRHRTGDLQSRLTSDVDTADGLLKTLVEDLASEVVMLIGTISFLIVVNPSLTAFVLPTIPALAISVFFFKRTIKRVARQLRDLIGEIASLAGETISGVRVLKAFCGEEYEASRFSAKSIDLLKARVGIAKLQSIYSSTVDVWVFAGTMIVILTASPRIIAGTFTVGALVAYLSYLNKLYGPAKALSKINVSIQKILAAGDRIFEVMDVASELQTDQQANGEAVNGHSTSKYSLVAEKLPRKDLIALGLQEVKVSRTPQALKNELDNRRLSGAVRFEDINFEYDEERPVLKNFNLDVQPGEVVSLVGHSGGGKTTIVNLLLRFYRPTSGRVLVDGVPIEDIPLSTLRRQIGLVQQETFLFSGTLRDNIAYANPEATTEQIMDAARAAYAHDFIMQLPKGYRTEVGERGVKLSGGQRQRIAIARALLRDPRILIFDEATSHLDSESEQLVRQALERIAQGRTVFIIAHRLSSVWRADKIVVIEDGELIQLGSHQDLLASNGLYRRLYSLQLEGHTEILDSTGISIS
ncbi:MAG TPA: ABC transporter ATP-binding protein [Pyrinomonadaceae bacterium]|nr:ABC transporter ATP-binding protein [Pyrinomonadaceae bacterium]